jgi:3-oxoacyl-[acyl-carrier-protein] synthase II
MPGTRSRTLELHRVVVTGMGTVNPVGNDVSTSWNALLKGVSGVAPLVGFDTEDLPVKFGAQIKGFDPETVIDKKEARRYDKFLQFSTAAAVEAMNDAGWTVPSERAERTGVLIGTGIAGLQTMYDNCVALATKGPRRISAFFVPYAIANMASGIVSMRYGARGPNSCVVTACTTGTHAIGDAFRILQRGDADVMIAGGVEAPVNRLGVAGFAAMRALSTRNDDPERASRPFDRNRDGFVISEAAGVVVLESLEHALARGARIHAELIGYGMSGDANHMTAPPEDGIGAQLSMRAALRDAGLAPEEVGYINAHGTATVYNDRNETAAIKTVFGEQAYKIPVSSTKSMIGHTLGAAGGIEAAFSVLALHRGVVPPTINRV